MIFAFTTAHVFLRECSCLLSRALINYKKCTPSWILVYTFLAFAVHLFTRRCTPFLIFVRSCDHFRALVWWFSSARLFQPCNSLLFTQNAQNGRICFEHERQMTRMGEFPYSVFCVGGVLRGWCSAWVGICRGATFCGLTWRKRIASACYIIRNSVFR